MCPLRSKKSALNCQSRTKAPSCKILKNAHSFGTDPGELVQAYTYDAVGNPTQILDSSGDLNKYGYDNKYRLTSANFTPVSNKFYTYTYDAVDNRTFSSEDGATTSTFNAAGQITVGNALGVLSTYTYDSDGNNTVVQTAATFVSMVYDQENRMTVHKSGTTLNTFTYQADNMKRTEKLGATTTTIIWDGRDYLGAV